MADDPKRPFRDRVGSLLRIITYAGFINFALFFVAALFLGGDAWNGTVQGGNFYLSENGRLTQVSRFVFYYSFIHAITVLIATPLAIVCGIARQIIQRTPKTRVVAAK